MAKNTKIIVFRSSIGQTGQTSIANLVGLSLAKSGKYVALLELSKYTGMSTFINKNLGNLKNDLKTCLIDPKKVKNNLVESRHSPRFMYISQNAKSTASDLASYNSSNIDEIVGQLYGIFDYIFIDLPSEIDDVAVVRVLSKSFNYNIDHHVVVITENVLALKKLNDYDNLIAKSMSNIRERAKTTLVVNKSKGRYAPLFEPYLSELPYSEIVNLVGIINVEEFPYLCNEGDIYSLGNTKEAKEFFGSIDILSKIIEEDVEGVGVSRSIKTSKTLRKAKMGSRLFDNKKSKDKNNKQSNGGLFGSKKSKKPKKPKTKKQKNGKRDKQPRNPQGQTNFAQGNSINSGQYGGNIPDQPVGNVFDNNFDNNYDNYNNYQ